MAAVSDLEVCQKPYAFPGGSTFCVLTPYLGWGIQDSLYKDPSIVNGS